MLVKMQAAAKVDSITPNFGEAYKKSPPDQDGPVYGYYWLYPCLF
jgi:hypothetical protein